ncbi:MAG: DUF4878 domain-containing protein [Burkholderiaceae bacterium]|nr:DUF4878 domain-containing protein [Burkholderiaceae bacterium]
MGAPFALLPIFLLEVFMLLHRIFALRFFMACLLGVLLVACGTSTSPSPESVVKDFYKAIADNRTEDAMALVLIEEVEESELTAAKGIQQMMFDILSSEIEKSGGLKSVETKRMSQEGDTAVIDVTLTYGNGKQWKAGMRILVKKNGRWVIDASG